VIYPSVPPSPPARSTVTFHLFKIPPFSAYTCLKPALCNFDMSTLHWVPPRDYVGFGLEPNRHLWPGERKIAVSFVLNYEE